MTIIKNNYLSLLKTNVMLFALITPSLVLAQDNTLSKAEQAQGWQLLFNGQNMEQWRNFKKPDLNDKWRVENGEMKLVDKGSGDILTKKAYQNFDLRLEWKISIAGNSGIFIMADEIGEYIYSHAPEVQILDNERHSDNKVDSHLSGSLYGIIASPIDSQKTAEQWNQVRILLNKNTLKVWQNNVMTVDVLVGKEQWQNLLSKSKFKNWQGFGLTEVGHIGLQDHGDPVAFKNIKIKVL
jgi:hypothetical protein